MARAHTTIDSSCGLNSSARSDTRDRMFPAVVGGWADGWAHARGQTRGPSVHAREYETGQVGRGINIGINKIRTPTPKQIIGTRPKQTCKGPASGRAEAWCLCPCQGERAERRACGKKGVRGWGHDDCAACAHPTRRRRRRCGALRCSTACWPCPVRSCPWRAPRPAAPSCAVPRGVSPSRPARAWHAWHAHVTSRQHVHGVSTSAHFGGVVVSRPVCRFVPVGAAVPGCVGKCGCVSVWPRRISTHRVKEAAARFVSRADPRHTPALEPRQHVLTRQIPALEQPHRHVQTRQPPATLPATLPTMTQSPTQPSKGSAYSMVAMPRGSKAVSRSAAAWLSAASRVANALAGDAEPGLGLDAPPPAAAWVKGRGRRAQCRGQRPGFSAERQCTRAWRARPGKEGGGNRRDESWQRATRGLRQECTHGGGGELGLLDIEAADLEGGPELAARPEDLTRPEARWTAQRGGRQTQHGLRGAGNTHSRGFGETARCRQRPWAQLQQRRASYCIPNRVVSQQQGRRDPNL